MDCSLEDMKLAGLRGGLESTTGGPQSSYREGLQAIKGYREVLRLVLFGEFRT